MTTMNGWPSVPLGEVLTETSREERVDSGTLYSLLGARWYARGLYTKQVKSGSQIKASSLYRVLAGDFVYNRLFAWKGSFAVASIENDGCYVSNEFPCFSADRSRLVPEFLWYYFSREESWNRAFGLSTGATPTSRNRLKQASLLEMTVPLPPLEEQHRIVTRINHLAAKIVDAASTAHQMDLAADSLLMSAYNVIVESAQRRPLGDVAPLVRRPAEIDPSKEYPQVSVRSFGKGTFHNPPLAGNDITWQKPYLVKNDDILISNIKAWEGAIAVAGPEDDGRYGSHRYLTFVPVKGMATAHFLSFHLLSPEGLYHIGKASPGSADRNRTLSSRAMLDIPVPVPLYEKQLWFGRVLTRINAIRQLRRETTAARDAMLPAILDRAFKGKLS